MQPEQTGRAITGAHGPFSFLPAPLGSGPGGSRTPASAGALALRRVWSKARRGHPVAPLPSESPKARFQRRPTCSVDSHLSGFPRLWSRGHGRRATGEWLRLAVTERLLSAGLRVRSPWSLWRNRLARSAVNRKVGGSSPPRDVGERFVHRGPLRGDTPACGLRSATRRETFSCSGSGGSKNTYPPVEVSANNPRDDVSPTPRLPPLSLGSCRRRPVPSLLPGSLLAWPGLLSTPLSGVCKQLQRSS